MKTFTYDGWTVAIVRSNCHGGSYSFLYEKDGVGRGSLMSLNWKRDPSPWMVALTLAHAIKRDILREERYRQESL